MWLWELMTVKAGARAEGPPQRSLQLPFSFRSRALPMLIAFRCNIPAFSVCKLGHDQSIAPANLKPIKSNLAQRLVGTAQPYRT